MRAPGSLLHRQDELALLGAYKKGGLNVTQSLLKTLLSGAGHL